MVKNQFVYNNVPIKKISWGKQDGFIEIKLFDKHYNKIFAGKAKLKDRKEVKRLFTDLKHKGFNYFNETSWF